MPNIYIIAGPNGAGKTTASNVLIPHFLNCKEFVNADSIAQGLSPFNAKTMEVRAARLMLLRIKELIELRANFAFETTLTTRSYVALLNDAKKKGYKIFLFYFWINSVDLALNRISERVSKGGHDVPRVVVERRFYRSLNYLVNIFFKLVNYWYIIDNNSPKPILIAKGRNSIIKKIFNENIWRLIHENEKKT